MQEVIIEEQAIDGKTLQTAVSIIVGAEDARVLCRETLNAIADRGFELTNERIKEAGERITETHRVQTGAIRGETRGKKREYTLLFAHAQDTSMTIYSEINLAKQMLKIFESWEERFQALGQK